MDHYLTPPRTSTGSSPEHQALSKRLTQERTGWFIKHGYEKTDFELPYMDFVEFPGESLIDSLREDPTWLTYYRRTKDA